MDFKQLLTSTILITLWMAIVDHVTGLCDFPEFLQTRDTDTWWLHHVTHAGAQTSNNTLFYIDIHGDRMSLTSLPGPNVVTDRMSYKRRCLKQLGNNTYLVKHFESGQGLKYICIQFYERSDFVVQILTSNYSSQQHPDLCEGPNLSLDPWPLLKYEESYLNETTCSILGGFDMVMFDKENNEVCVDKYITPRLESTCNDNNFLYFDFGTCHLALSKIGMELKQKVACIANWNMGGHEFSVLRRIDSAMFWLLKFEKEKENTYNAYVTSDIITQTGDISDVTQRFVKLQLEKNIFNSTCIDISPFCSDVDMCDKDDPFAQVFCKRSCGFCENTTDCVIDQKYQGEWWTVWGGKHGAKREAWMNVTAGGIIMPGLGEAECIGADTLASSYSLVVGQSTGCYPQVYCLTLHTLSPSVILYNLQRSDTWPIYSELQPCYATTNHIQGTSHVTPAVRHEHLSESCGIPGKNHSLLAIFPDGSSCTGYLAKPSCEEEESQYVSLVYGSCQRQDRRAARHLTCLAHMPTVTTRKYVLTVEEETHTYVCLYFSNQMHELVVLPPTSCHDGHQHADMVVTLQFTGHSSSCQPVWNSSDVEGGNHCQAQRIYGSKHNTQTSHPTKSFKYMRVSDKIVNNNNVLKSVPESKSPKDYPTQVTESTTVVSTSQPSKTESKESSNKTKERQSNRTKKDAKSNPVKDGDISSTSDYSSTEQASNASPYTRNMYIMLFVVIGLLFSNYDYY